MKVLWAKAPGIAEYVDLPKPEAKGDGVVVKVKSCGICATDLAILSGAASFMHDGSTTYPVRFGHEWCGVVESVGEGVTTLKPGDRVISDCSVPCGECEACKRGDKAGCTHRHSVGTINTWPGGFAEYTYFPEENLHKVPDTLSFEQASMIEPGAISVAGVKHLNLEACSDVLIIGTGAIGICAVTFAKALGAKRVILAGRTDSKLEVGRKMGADEVFNTREQSITDYIREHCGGMIGNVLECSGNLAVLDECIEVVAKDGYLSLAGFFDKLYPNFDIDKFIMKAAHMNGVMGGDEYTRIAFEKVTRGGVDLTGAITRRIGFDEAGDMMTKMIHASKNAEIKVMVNFD